MTVTILGGQLASGVLPAPPSKSYAQRAMIFAALSDAPTRISGFAGSESEDISACRRCLCALGASHETSGDTTTVYPISARRRSGGIVRLEPGKSAACLRFLLPVAAALGCAVEYNRNTLPPGRPVEPLLRLLSEHGCTVMTEGNSVRVCGRLLPGDFRVDCTDGSQPASGLLIALPLCGGDSTLTLTGGATGYVSMTAAVAAEFGARCQSGDAEKKSDIKAAESYTSHESDAVETARSGDRDKTLNIKAVSSCTSHKTGAVESDRSGDGDKTLNIKAVNAYSSPGACTVESDWSAAGFLLAAGAAVSGMNPDSVQPDAGFPRIIARLGGQVVSENGALRLRREKLRGAVIDMNENPDLVPVIAALCATAEGETLITGAARLRYKESDRLRTLTETLSAFGADISQTSDGLRIKGVPRLHGADTEGCGDHRIVMAATAAALAAEGESRIYGAEAINKSYPDAFERLRLAGAGIAVSDTENK